MFWIRPNIYLYLYSCKYCISMTYPIHNTHSFSTLEVLKTKQKQKRHLIIIIILLKYIWLTLSNFLYKFMATHMYLCIIYYRLKSHLNRNQISRTTLICGTLFILNTKFHLNMSDTLFSHLYGCS